MKGKIPTVLLCLITTIFLVSIALAQVDITATVNNLAPSVGAIQLCDGSCAYSKTIDPKTEFTVKVTVTDPNGAADLNDDNFTVMFYRTDWGNTCTAGWDCVKKFNITSATNVGTGCTASGNDYCLTVGTGDWGLKFLAGGADIYVVAYDNSAASDTNEAVNNLTINSLANCSQDQSAVSYAASDPGTSNIAMSPAYIRTANTGNDDINVTVTATDLDSGTAIIGDGNMHWDLNGTPPGTSFTGGADLVIADLNRGADPIDQNFDTYTWLNIPTGQPAGTYTGTFTFNCFLS